METFPNFGNVSMKNSTVFSQVEMKTAMGIVGAGIIYLGLVAPSFSTTIALVGAFILTAALTIGGITLKNNKT